MAGSVNKVILIGNLGRDPEVRTMQSGDRVVNLSIATSESWKDKATGERREKSEWHRVVIFNQGLINVCENYLKKGSKVYIEGQLETRKWTDQASGQDKYSTEVVLRPYRGELTMLDSRNSGGASAGGGYGGGDSFGGGQQSGGANFNDSGANDFQSGGAPQQQQSASSAGAGGDFDDEIPF